MTPKETKATLQKPQMLRLKDLGGGMHVGRVLGNRVLVSPVKPHTEMDEVEKKGLLVIPETVREANTPKETTGLIVMVGSEVSDTDQMVLREGVAIIFGKYSGFEILVEEEPFRIIDVEDILCTIEFEDPTAVVPVRGD